MESLFQQAAQSKDQPATPATPATTPAPPTGSAEQMFQQAAQQQTPEQQTPVQPPAPKESWMERVGHYIPESITPALAFGQKYLSEPLEAAGRFTKETGQAVGRAPAEMLTFAENADAYMPNPRRMGPVSVEPVESAAKRLHPTLSGVGEGIGGFAGSMLSPENLVIMAAMPEAEAFPVLSKVLTRGFAAMMTKQSVEAVHDVMKKDKDGKSNWSKMDPQQKASWITENGLQTAMTAASIAHAATPTEPGQAPKAEVAPEIAPEVPETKGTVKGPRTRIRPTTQTTAGVEAPVSAIAQENAPLTAKAATKFTTPGMAKEFQRAATAPAAQQQMVSTLGQVAEDSIAAHNALMEGTPTPDAIAGTQQRSKYGTIDAVAQAAKGTSEKTYQKADAISARETSAWEAQRDKAIADHKAALDHYNELVDFHNNNLEEGNEPLERAQFNPEEVRGIPDKPKTYSELKSELEQAKADGVSGDTAVRTKAWQTDIPKAEKNLDKWFNDHADEISPAEYKSARKLRADAENYQTMANSLRGAINKGTITGNTLRGLEATIDNKAIRRGQAPGVFKRMLGPEGYDNWQNVTKLLDPIKGGTSLGQYTLEWLGAHALGPLGMVGKAAVEFLLNKIMFNPNWGSWFSSVANSLRDTGGVPQSLRDTFTNLWRSERGEAGLPGSVPLSPEEEQISEHRQNGGSTFSAEGKNLAGTDAYSVGSYPERTERHDELTPEVLADFKDRNSDVLSQPDHMVGTWKNPVSEPQSFSDLGNGVYEVKTNVDGDTNGHLTAKEVEGNPDAARVESHWVAAGQRGKGIGSAQLQKMAESLADAGKTTLLSDTEMTDQARKAWDRLKKENPDAVKKTSRGYIYDLTKLKSETPTNEMSMQPGPAGFPEAKVTRKWPTDDQLIEKYGEANDPSQVAFLTKDGRGVAMKGTEHDRMLGGKPTDDLRTPYVNETGNIRMRSYGVYGDRQFNFSLPEGGISQQQYDQIMKWAPQLRTGRVYLETANPQGGNQVLTAPSNEDLGAAIKQLVPVEGQKADTGGIPDRASSEISTRRPTATNADMANDPNRVANLAAVEQARQSRITAGGKQAMGLKEKLARTVANYAGIPYSEDELANPDHVINKFVNRVSDNLEWLYNQIPESIRNQTKEWYPSAHKVLSGFSKDYGVSMEQAAGVTAALSPQNPWDNNVALAKRMMDVYKNRQNFSFTPEMEQKSAELRKVPTQSRAFKGLLKDIAGKKLSQIKNADPDVQAVQRALWIRLYDEAHNSSLNDQYSPNGEVTGHSPDARSWIGLDHMGKAVKILDNGSVDNIHDVMGQGHKIRNFYNNLINPYSKNGHVTIDTHAVSAGHLSPFGPKDTEAAHNFGGSTPGVPTAGKDAATGLGGTYPLYVEAYQRAAKKLGVLPRELQSITWEAVKSLMGDEKKTPELKKRVREIWTDVQEGRLTPEQARDKVKSEAGGFAKPSWMSDEEWDRVSGESGDTSFEP